MSYTPMHMAYVDGNRHNRGGLSLRRVTRNTRVQFIERISIVMLFLFAALLYTDGTMQQSSAVKSAPSVTPPALFLRTTIVLYF